MMMLEPAKVSVIIPCYNCSLTIHRTVNSVLAQTQLPMEILLIEDKSTDKTLEIINQLAVLHPSVIKVIAIVNNQGAANARNVGWSLAQQPYIAFLDADDAWHVEKIKVQYNFMLNNPDVILSGHGHKIVKTNNPLNWNIPSLEIKTIKKFKILLSNQFVTPSVMMKNNKQYSFNATKRYVDDHLLWLTIAYDNNNIVKLNIDLVAIYKPLYGASGLSSNLWKMEKSELDNYMILYKKNKINISLFGFTLVYSFAKYIRRLLILGLRYFKST